MSQFPRVVPAVLLALVLPLVSPRPCPADAVDLPAGVRAVWDIDKAVRDATPTRERVCINGLWRWQPAQSAAVGPADDEAVPAGGWGWFKVPGSWPGVTDYMQKDCQTLYAHPSWKDRGPQAQPARTAAAWYQRSITVPPEWKGRRVVLSVDSVNSYAAVYVDGKRAGEVHFPGGEVDLTAACRPGATHELSLRVVALPLADVVRTFHDTAASKQAPGSVSRRGLCGDAYLVSTPPGPRVEGVKVDPSVRNGELRVGAALDGLTAGRRYALRAAVLDAGREVAAFKGQPFTADGARAAAAVVGKWKPDKLWDLHTPGNVYAARVSVVDLTDDPNGKVVDTAWDERFGFREFWIDGRDFYLNGSRIWLSAVPLDNAQIGAAWANYDAARETFRRLKAIGINFVYTHHYDCAPGAHLGLDEILRAADDEGVLVALTQPHFGQYEWPKTADEKADDAGAYARHAAYYVRAAGSHPSVVCYSTSHNATGYAEDMNPDLIGGERVERDNWAANNAKLALRAEGIIRRLDPARIVYHHAGGNIGSMHTMNFYPNFVPIQELSDWFGPWATAGTKPAFMCEYGAPFTWDWTMYRGWYEGKREFGSANVPWELCMAEWNAQFLGDRAFDLGEPEKADLRWEAKQFAAGKAWHRWDYPVEVGSPRFIARHEVIGEYLTDNWRASRTWGVSGVSPWEYGHYWITRPGVDRRRKDLPVDWDHLQRPGLSPDYIDQRMERMDVAFEAGDWEPTADGARLYANNLPVLAYVAGRAGAFTSKDHIYRAGETVEKQLIVINNSRQTLEFRCDWAFALPKRVAGEKKLSLDTGQKAEIPLRFDLPPDLAPGAYDVATNVAYDPRVHADSFPIHVRPALERPAAGPKVALYDPRGQTADLLKQLGVAFRPVGADAGLSAGDTLVIGKLALTVDGPAPDVSRVRDGMKVIVFEQSADVLEKRLGFRVTEYGLRRAFPRIPDHPLLAGIQPEHLSDWRGEATTTPPRLAYEMRPMHGPTLRWCDIPVTRPWRCGNRGNVASVLIEKPARGDFRPVLDGGYSLQYSPLMEYREGKGLVVFCQLDVTGRTDQGKPSADPAAEALAANVLRYAAGWKPPTTAARRVVYAGDDAGRRHLEAVGFTAAAYDGGDLSAADHVLVVGPGGGAKPADRRAAVGRFLDAGGNVLAVALGQADADAFLPVKVALANAEHIGASFEPPAADSPFAGIGPADVHSRAPRDLPLVKPAAGAAVLGDGVLAVVRARADKPGAAGVVVFCQTAPWQFDDPRQPNLRRTYRRTSFTLARLLANLGAAAPTPILGRFHTPARVAPPEKAGQADKRWLEGLYVDVPDEWDDPYRFFRW